ncbi:MAG: hypothetical protein N2749_00730 [Clostridia bacterium]|nr:hypothetical protein [Clostridia bacterium]
MEQNKKIEDFSVMDDLNIFFDNFIKTGEVVKEKEIAPNFKVKLRVLNTGELLAAETILKATNDIPTDIVAKVRAASILSQAIISINDLDIEKNNATQEENNLRRINLYKQLLRMPAIIVQKTYALYIDAVQEQNSLYENLDETVEKVKNF